MSTGWKFNQIAGVIVLCAGVLCLRVNSVADTATAHGQRKTKKPPQLPDLPSGPTGRPVPAIPLDSMAPVAPQVSYQNSQLTIVAPNSTLGDILRAVKKQTGAEIDIPSAPERVVTHLGPGPAREVLAELLNGSRFNYVLLGSSADNAALARVVLVVKTGPDSVSPPSGPSVAEQQQLGIVPPGQPISSAQEPAPEANEADAAEENADENADQAAAEAEQQQPPNPDQPGVKTPQEMLQEMQQRQLMLQQQQPPGQPPVPGNGVQQRPPQDQ